MKILYIENVDKPKMMSKNFKIEQDNCKISANLEKEKNIKKLTKKLKKIEISGVVLCTNLSGNVNLINALNANSIKIFDGRWLEKYLSIQILDYILKQKNENKQETEIAITINQITDFSIELIKYLAKEYKRVTVVTPHIEKLKNIEKEIYHQEGSLIVVSNNKKKSLLKSKIILNIDFDKVILNRYKINENAIIVNLEGDMKIEDKRFNGINVNQYEIDIGREDIIWRKNMRKFKIKDLLEAVIYSKDTYQNISKKISKNKVSIKELYGLNGKIERFY